MGLGVYRGFGFRGLGFRSLGFRVWGLGFWGLGVVGFRVSGLFPKIRGTPFGAPYNKGYNIWGSILGSPCFGKLPLMV